MIRDATIGQCRIRHIGVYKDSARFYRHSLELIRFEFDSNQKYGLGLQLYSRVCVTLLAKLQSLLGLCVHSARVSTIDCT